MGKSKEQFLMDQEVRNLELEMFGHFRSVKPTPQPQEFDPERNPWKIDYRKAIVFLVEKAYRDEFEVIDGISQHPDGWNFTEWLNRNNLTI